MALLATAHPGPPLYNALAFAGLMLKGNGFRINPFPVFSPNDKFPSHIWVTDSPKESAWEEKQSGLMFI